MFKFHSRYPNSFLPEKSILFVIIFSFLVSGCAEKVTPLPISLITPVTNPPATPIIWVPQATVTQMIPAQTEILKLTNTPLVKMTINSPHVSPNIKVIVTNIGIRSIINHPGQLELVIKGTLPDQCQYRFSTVESRVDKTIKINFLAIHPNNNDCQQKSQNIEYILPLGRDMPEADRALAPGNYTISVNKFQISYSVK